ncbi:hypothetical protein NC652_025825 [Populus alba x Populus x berolinensis]|nr:hypothetical protein NC652_025825 [Populus alba x Populus x berolinensis]
MNMTRQQKDALEIRSYLHDRALLQYGDKLEASGKCLPELLSLSTGDLSSHFGMKRGHIARLMDRTGACEDPLLKSYAPLTARKMNSRVSRNNSNFKSDASVGSKKMQTISNGYIFKGVVAAGPAELRACGCVQPPPVVDSVAPYSSIENISVQKLTPEYKIGMEHLVKTKTPPMKALPNNMDKSTFKNDFWPRYWGGVVLFDRSMEFFKALDGGRLLKDKFISGFIFNPRAIANYKRAKAMGIDRNFKGEGEIKGGLFIVGRDKSGIAYQFIERNFGDWAPVAEVIDICSKLRVS